MSNLSPPDRRGGQQTSSTPTSQERHLRAKIGAFSLHATHDPKVTTAKARESFLDRFVREVDPENVLPEAERQRRAEYARRAHMTRLALKSAKARRRCAASAAEEKKAYEALSAQEAALPQHLRAPLPVRHDDGTGDG